jgi:hypothetical protein
MKKDRLAALLADFKAGRVTSDEALTLLRRMPVEDLGFAKVDHHRSLRRGFPEVVLAGTKTPAQVIAIVKATLARGNNALVTKMPPELYARVKGKVKGAVYSEAAQALVVKASEPKLLGSKVAVITAGTSDIPVGEEAALTLEFLGVEPVRFWDVGIAGVHRLAEALPIFEQCDILIVIAGMDGALPSVVAGMTDRPVIAVPTSVGYGASFGGLAPLLAMLNSCSPGVGVVNIDNGFGAAMLAGMIVKAFRSPQAALASGDSRVPRRRSKPKRTP